MRRAEGARNLVKLGGVALTSTTQRTIQCILQVPGDPGRQFLLLAASEQARRFGLPASIEHENAEVVWLQNCGLGPDKKLELNSKFQTVF